ncbi:MAG: hypothetical protein IT573_11010 [Deltaproteobacteria bacterium]|nr:hypothetical protein [Deltaproteobacteria bacterium]
MTRMLTRFFVIPYLIGFLVACGGGGGNGNGGDLNSVVGNQNEAMSDAAAKALELLTSFDSFHQNQEAIATYDENTGQAWLDFYNDEFIPGIEELEVQLDIISEEEANLAALVDQQKALLADPTEKFIEPVTLIYISGVVTFVGVVSTWVAFKNSVVPQVKRVEDKIKQGRDQGKTQAQAMAEASSTYKDAQNKVFLETQKTIAVNSLFNTLSNGLESCGKIVVDLINIAGDNIDKAKVKLFGKKKGSSGGNLKLGTVEEGLFFIGSADNGLFENVPLGDYDLYVFKDGYVRGNALNVSCSTCNATTNATVTMATIDEFFQDTGGDDGSFEIVSFVNSDGSQGTDLSQAQLKISGSAANPTFTWPFSNAIAFFVADPQATLVYGIESLEDQNQDPIFFNSPVTYGNYGVPNTGPLDNALNPSPALQVGTTYTAQVGRDDATSASLIFIPR